MSDKSVVVGSYLVIHELNGSGNVYGKEGAGKLLHHADTFEDAKRWAYEEQGFHEPALETRERAQQKKPCKQCPWRRKSMPGWLGEAFPESFVATILVDSEPLPCHSTIDYSDPQWYAKWAVGSGKAKLCAGALTAAANTGRVLRLGKPVKADPVTVFATLAEFVEHHRKLRISSWKDPAPGTRDRHGLDEVRKTIGLPVLTKGSEP